MKKPDREELSRGAARYPKTVRWSEHDACFVGTLHGLGGDCCHGDDPVEVYKEVEQIAFECVEAFAGVGKPLPGLPGVGSGTDPDPAAIREAMGLSQSQFARMLGVSVKTLHKWEQRTSRPSGAARSLLKVAAKSPGAVLGAL